MKKHILLEEKVQAFILTHKDDDPAALMLQREKYPDWPFKEVVDQIISRRKAEKKLPLWYKTKGILYPVPVSIEQSSSEATAAYKAGLFNGKKAADLTGGLGVDSYYLAHNFEQLTYVEQKETLAEIATHNFDVLGQNNVEIVNSTAEEFLLKAEEKYDLIYIDPDRRPDQKRVVGFSDSTPDLLELLPKLMSLSENILIKASPMMDIRLALEQLRDVGKVIILAIDNEVKELLFHVGGDTTATTIRCVNINKGQEDVLEYNLDDNSQEFCKISLLSNYLYEPNAAIMKAGAFNHLCKSYFVKKLHPNTHLFTSDKHIVDIPGRKFKVIGSCAYKKSAIQQLLKGNKANISVRNFVDTPEQVKKKLGLQDGGDQYLFGYRDNENKLRVAVCERV
ncbi:MAG: hypothetical protein ABFS32_12805 [Bacteroidota bacterium]